MLRLGLAGTGAMAEYQAQKFMRLPSCELVACVDRNPENAESFARRFGIAQSYGSIGDMLDGGLCTAFSCVTTDRQHARLASAALERGLPVFCEKPLARTLAECEELARKAAAAGTLNLVNFSKRNAPALAALKAVVASGELGDTEAVEAEYAQGWVLSKVWGDWRSVPRWRWRLLPDESSGGVAGDLGSHLVDALIYVFGGLAAKKGAVSIDLAQALAASAPETELPEEFIAGPGPVCVEFKATALLPGGAPAAIRASWIEPGALDEFKIRVKGTRGEALLDLSRSRSAIELRRYDSSMPRVIVGQESVSSYQRFAELAAAPLDAAALADLASRHGLPDFAHGLLVQRTLDALLPGGLPL